MNHKLNGDGKDKGVLDQIDALKDHLTQDQLDKYKNEATGAHKTYTGNVNGDTNVSDINSDKKHGLDAMQAALDEATLQAAKNDANKKLQQDAQDAIDKINGMTNLTDDQKKMRLIRSTMPFHQILKVVNIKSIMLRIRTQLIRFFLILRTQSITLLVILLIRPLLLLKIRLRAIWKPRLRNSSRRLRMT